VFSLPHRFFVRCALRDVITNKHQISSTKHQTFGVWNLSFVWDLEFEIYEG